VLLTGTTLLLKICEESPEAVTMYSAHTKLLVKVLKQLVQSSFSPEHDVGGINDPFLQCQILRLLRYLGKNNAEASDVMSDILAQVATNTEPTRNAGNAILYECVETIMGIEATQGLRVLAVNIMGRFLANKDNNIRYVALNTLAKMVAVDTQAVQRHRNTIVDCVKDADVSIRRRALELVYALINETNIKTLTKELLDYLEVSDSTFKPDLTQKIAQLVQKFAPDRRWYMDNMVVLLNQAGPYIKPEIWRSLIVVITNTPDLQGYMVRALYRALCAGLDRAAASLILVAVWVIGEYGDVLVNPGSAFLDGEEPLRVTGAEAVKMLEVLLSTQACDSEMREYIVTALVKMAAHVPETRPQVEQAIGKHTTSTFLEVQQRSCEFDRLFKSSSGGLFAKLVEHMPPLTEAEYMKATGASTLQSSDATASPKVDAPATGHAAADSLADLMGMNLLDSPTTDAAPTAATAAPDPIHDLLGLDATTPQAPGASAPGELDLNELFGSASPAAAPLVAPSHPPVTAFQKDGLSVVLTFTKPSPGRPELTDAVATMSNTNAQSIDALTLQVAVPKFMQLRLDPASGNALPPVGAPVTQGIHLTNTMHGQKPIALRLRIAYTVAGQPKVEMAEVSGLPLSL